MHEYSIVEHLLEHLQAELQRQGVMRVREIRIRRGGTFAEGPLLQAFEMIAPETILAGAKLIVDEFSVTQACANCGHTQEITTDDLIGHIYICPECGAMAEIDEARGLEIVSITADGIVPLNLISEAHCH